MIKDIKKAYKMAEIALATLLNDEPPAGVYSAVVVSVYNGCRSEEQIKHFTKLPGFVVRKCLICAACDGWVEEEGLGWEPALYSFKKKRMEGRP